MESYGKTANIKDSSTAFVINKYIKIIDENKGIINKEVEDEVISDKWSIISIGNKQ